MEGEKYYALPKGKRWMEGGDNPIEMGGRSTDIEQLYFSLERNVEGAFDPVPIEILAELTRLQMELKSGEDRIQKIINMVSDKVAQQDG